MFDWQVRYLDIYLFYVYDASYPTLEIMEPSLLGPHQLLQLAGIFAG